MVAEPAWTWSFRSLAATMLELCAPAALVQPIREYAVMPDWSEASVEVTFVPKPAAENAYLVTVAAVAGPAPPIRTNEVAASVSPRPDMNTFVVARR